MPKLRHFDNEGTARFVTFGCYRKLPLLTDDTARRIFLEELEQARSKYAFRILGYVLMPEHLHLVLLPPDGMPLGLLIREIKSRSARRVFALEGIARPGVQRVFWQKRCYDHNCRTLESTIEKINYCHNNPVRRGLVSAPGEWRWSSYRCYCGSKDVLLEVDRVEM
jgi:putative transposase